MLKDADAARARLHFGSPAASWFSGIVSAPSLRCASGAEGVFLPRFDRVLASLTTPHHARGFSSSQSTEDGNSSSNNDEVNNYDPRCGMSKEEFEWRCAQQKRVCQRMPQALHKLKTCSERMRRHFLNDPDALAKWDEYANDVYDSFEDNLQYSLSSPLDLPDSVCYRHIMKSKARSKTPVGMQYAGLMKLRRAAGNRSIVVAGAIMTLGTAAGLAVDQWKKQHTKETRSIG